MLGMRMGVNKSNQLQRVRNGLVLYLDSKDFTNSPPTASLRDRSGNNNNATPSGFAYTTASGSDNAGDLVFSGGTEYLLTSSFANTSAMTFEVKVSSTFSGTAYMLLDWRTVGGVGIAPIYITGSGQIQYYNGVASYVTTSNPFVYDGKYHTITVKGNNTIIKVYVDNVFIQSFSASMGNIQSPTGLRIGQRYNGQFPFKGNVKHVCLYNRMLSDSENTQNFNASK